MGLLYKTGSFALNTTTGNQAVSVPGGFGGQTGKVLRLYATRETAVGTKNPGTNGESVVGVGGAVSAAGQAAVGLMFADGAASGTTRRATSDTSCIIIPKKATNTVDFEAVFVSWDTDGFTINITTAPGAAYLVFYEIIGGSDITDVALVSFQMPTGLAQDQDVTTLGFSPDHVDLFGNGRQQLTGVGTGGAVFLGAFSSAGDQWAAMIGKGSVGSNTVASRILRSDRCWATDAGIDSSTKQRASWVSMLAAGFRIHWDSLSGTDSPYIFAIGYKGTHQFKVGTFAKDTTTPTGSNDVNVGFAASGIFVASGQMPVMTAHGDNDPDTADAHNRGGVGCSDGSNHWALAWADEHDVATTNVEQFLSSSSALIVADNAAGTTDAEGTIAFSDPNMTFAWSTNDATATLIAYRALGTPTPSTQRARPSFVGP